jgi:hypothetical protein
VIAKANTLTEIRKVVLRGLAFLKIPYWNSAASATRHEREVPPNVPHYPRGTGMRDAWLPFSIAGRNIDLISWEFFACAFGAE